MKTTNWQTKALTLFITAVALWLVTACRDLGTNNEVPLAKDTTEQATETNYDYSMCGENFEEGDGSMTITDGNRGERIHEVRLKYDALFWRQPNVHAVGEGTFYDDNGRMTEVGGIIVHVSTKVDQSTLPPEDRVPECLEGVPVQIRVDAPYMIDIGGQ